MPSLTRIRILIWIHNTITNHFVIPFQLICSLLPIRIQIEVQSWIRFTAIDCAEAHPVVVEAHNKAMEAHPGVVEARPGVVKGLGAIV
jgi:hypothetical protein